MAGGGPDPVPWAACLGKFAFWSWGRPKLYIRVLDIFAVTSTIVQSMVRCELWVFGSILGGFGERRRAWGKRGGIRRRKWDDRGRLRLASAAGAAGVAEGGGRRRWEASGTVMDGPGGWVFSRCPGFSVELSAAARRPLGKFSRWGNCCVHCVCVWS